MARGTVRALVLVGLVGAGTSFHTPYKPEQSRHFDVTKSSTFNPITEKVRRQLQGV